MKKIPVSIPFIDEKESNNVIKAFNYKAISGHFGNELKEFEEGFAKFSDSNYGITTTSGTTALHLALATLFITKGDEVLVSTLTNMATFFSVIYQGAKPIPIDIEEETYNIDPQLIESKITSKTKAIIVVHLFGHSVNMDPIIDIAKKYNLKIIEDCAEAHGATYKGKKVGSLGDIGCFSFYANKIITTGEGGMLTTNSLQLAERAKELKSLAFGKKNKFMHTDIGYNYRMTNIQAAIGCAQLDKIEHIIKSKIYISNQYRSLLKKENVFNLPIQKEYARNVYWMYHISINGKCAGKRDQIISDLKKCGIGNTFGY